MLSSILFQCLFLTILNLYGTNGDEITKMKSQLNQLQQNFNLFRNQFNDLKEATPECGQNWISYSDTKCFQVLREKASEVESKERCKQLDSKSTLVSILSAEEQSFLNSILEKNNDISDNVWIGLELKNKTYKWLDSNKLNFTNWDINADKKDKCVQLSLGKATLGNWRDDSCDRKYLIACQKKQTSQTVIRSDLDQVIQVVTKQQKKLKQQQNQLDQQKILIDEQKMLIDEQQIFINNQQDEINSIREELEFQNLNISFPVGYIYTQLPSQQSPEELWPEFNWVDITYQFAGLFFRAEGGDSLPFGRIQTANQSWISDVSGHGHYYSSWTGTDTEAPVFNGTLKEGKWVNVMSNGQIVALHLLEFYTTKGEVRPTNTAIRLWKRIDSLNTRDEIDTIE